MNIYRACSDINIVKHFFTNYYNNHCTNISISHFFFHPSIRNFISLATVHCYTVAAKRVLDGLEPPNFEKRKAEPLQKYNNTSEWRHQLYQKGQYTLIEQSDTLIEQSGGVKYSIITFNSSKINGKRSWLAAINYLLLC